MAGLLRATVRREGLEGRVRMLGAVPSERVRDVLVRAPRNASLSQLCCIIPGTSISDGPVIRPRLQPGQLTNAKACVEQAVDIVHGALLASSPAMLDTCRTLRPGSGRHLHQRQPDGGVLLRHRGGRVGGPPGRLHRRRWRPRGAAIVVRL